jgi:hypothetical protein
MSHLHLLAKLHGVNYSEIEKSLKADFLKHAAEGIFLEHLWQNNENGDEILFLFRIMNMDRAKKFLNSMHLEAIKADPGVVLPEMTFLEGD